MIELDFDVPFCEKYNIVAEEYEDVSVTTIPLSVRVINRFMRSGIKTVADLLKSTPATLMQLNGFGKGCFDEVVSYCVSLNNNGISSTINEQKTPSKVLAIFYSHRDDIIAGNFSVFDESSLTPKEKDMLKKYIEAYNILGEKIIFDCINSTDKIIPVMEMCIDFQNHSKRYIDIWNLTAALPDHRKQNKAYPYINAFTLKENERELLYNMCTSDASAILSLTKAEGIDSNESYLLLKRFLKWCTFDLSKDINDLFATLYTNDRFRVVVQMRARKHTLEQIGNVLGVTRERVRQIEAKVKRSFAHLQSRIRIISKISAERNGDTILTPIEIKEFCGSYTPDLLFLLQSYESANYTYDSQLDVFIIGDDSLRGRVQNYIDSLQDIVTAKQMKNILSEAAEEADVPYEMLEKAFLDAYRLTGEVYHRHRLSLAAIYERVLDTYYPQGFKAYDADEIRQFRNIIATEYGDVGIPENDHALTSRVTSICLLCGRGIYRLKNKSFLPHSLATRICEYIENNENTIFLTNTLFNIFENELISVGIDNRYFLHGVLRELFEDKFVFTRDYISKDPNVTSVYSSVVEFIKKSNFPVSKKQIQEAFPGITEVVINLSTSDPYVLNYFGEYLHASKLNILDYEKNYLFNIVDNLVSDGTAHHGEEIHDIITKEKPEILTRNAAMYQFSTFSILEFLFRDKFQFSRPYIALNNVEIDRPAERLHDLIYSVDEITISEISEFARDNRLQIQSFLDYINSCNDEFLLINNDSMMRIDQIGIDEDIASLVEDIIFKNISETIPIKNLTIWAELPTINIPWTEWLIYSTIFKWGRNLVVGTSSHQFRLSVPLIAPTGKYNPDAFKNLDRGHEPTSFVADDLSDLDALIEDIIGDDILADF